MLYLTTLSISKVIVSMSDEVLIYSINRMLLIGAKSASVHGHKSVPMPIYMQQTSHELVWVQTQATTEKTAEYTPQPCHGRIDSKPLPNTNKVQSPFGWSIYFNVM
jgi:hypothetical protein